VGRGRCGGGLCQRRDPGRAAAPGRGHDSRRLQRHRRLPAGGPEGRAPPGGGPAFRRVRAGPGRPAHAGAVGIPAGGGRPAVRGTRTGPPGVATSRAARWLASMLSRAGGAAAALFFVLLLGLPVLAILLRSLAGGALPAALGSPVVLQALRLTAGTSLAATGLAALLGTPVAYLLARRAFPGRALLDHLIELPIVLPP